MSLMNLNDKRVNERRWDKLSICINVRMFIF